MARKKKTDPVLEEVGPAPQVDEAEAKRVRRWMRKIRAAQKCREDWERQFQVERGEEYFLGKQWDDSVAQDSALVINHLAASIDVDIPNLFYQDPKWFIRPTIRSHPSVEQKARVAEATLEAVAKQDQSLKRAGLLAVLQSYFRLGCLETVYDPQLVPNPKAGQPVYKLGPDGEVLRYPPTLPGAPDPMTGIMPPPVPHPMAGEPVPMTGPDGEPVMEPEEILSDETFRFEWVDASLLLLDPDAGPDRGKWRWIGKEVLMPLTEARENSKFTKSVRQALEPTEFRKKKDEPERKAPPTDEAKLDEGFVRLFCCYDTKERTEYVIADGQSFEAFLYDGPLTDGLEDHPFSLLSYTPVLGPDPSPWPKPPVADWLMPQADYNKARWLVREHAERMLPKEVYDEATFQDEDEVEKYKRGAVGGLAKVQSTKNPPVPVAKPPMHDSLVRIVPMLAAEWRIITGQTGSRLGTADSDTATEAAFVERNANLRDSRKQDAINDWLSRAGWCMLKLLKSNLTLRMWVKLRGYTNQDIAQWLQRRGMQPALVRSVPGLYDIVLQTLGEEKWQEIGQEDLDFDAEVTVVPGSARARNLEVERKQWVEFLGILGGNPQIAFSRELLRETAAKFETVNERMIDEIYAMSQQMLAAKQQTAGHPGVGDNGGNATVSIPGGGNGVPNPLQAGIQTNTQALGGRAV